MIKHFCDKCGDGMETSLGGAKVIFTLSTLAVELSELCVTCRQELRELAEAWFHKKMTQD